MIDYLSLAIGHGLLALAFLRLVMRDDLDSDPEIKALEERIESESDATSVAGRNARRRAAAGGKSPKGSADDRQSAQGG